jgi:hypothetical protein
MKKASGYVVGGLMVLALAALLIYRLTQSESTGKVRRLNVPLVQVSHPQRQDVTYSLHYTGDVMAIQQAGIFSKVSGNLEKIYAEMGDAVHTDQLLALIDTTELYLQKMQASATWQNAKLSFDRASEFIAAAWSPDRKRTTPSPPSGWLMPILISPPPDWAMPVLQRPFQVLSPAASWIPERWCPPAAVPCLR